MLLAEGGPVRIAVLEAVSAGLFGAAPEVSLLREGLAMWRGLIEDLAQEPGVEVDTLLGVRWQEHRPDVPNLHVWPTDGPAEAMLCWNAALEEADAVIVIAPESDGCLRRLVEALPARVHSWNCSAAAIDLCSDKLRLADHLRQVGIATIPTIAENWRTPPAADEFPRVVKPQDGAGSYLVRQVADEVAWRRCRAEYSAAAMPHAIRQPLVRGLALSRAGWFAEGHVEWLPVAEQRLSTDGAFRYLGGTLPARITNEQQEAIEALLSRLPEVVLGLRGYVGCDIICPEQRPLEPVLVEINPRLTTSYVGYRRWLNESPWPEWLSGRRLALPATRVAGPVTFFADGQVAEDAP